MQAMLGQRGLGFHPDRCRHAAAVQLGAELTENGECMRVPKPLADNSEPRS